MLGTDIKEGNLESAANENYNAVEQADDSQELRVLLFQELCKIDGSVPINSEKVAFYAKEIAYANELNDFTATIAELATKLSFEKYSADPDSINYENGLFKVMKKYFGNLDSFSENSLRYASLFRDSACIPEISKAAFLLYKMIDSNGMDPYDAINEITVRSNDQIKKLLGKYFCYREIKEQVEFNIRSGKGVITERSSQYMN